MLRKKAIPLACSMMLVAVPATAEINFNGFASIVGGMTTKKDESFAGYNNDFEFQPDSVVGLQATGDVAEGLSATVQILARGQDDWDPQFEWAYISYDFTDNFNVKAGRLRFPNYYYSEFIDVAYTYHWIRPPEDVYAAELTSFDGISAMYTGLYWRI